ncbi:MAG: VWA domain-containing protein [Acidobacteria bacterium]|nr:VWA domain-containing protein [Acidobacteriota bacterium]
MRRLCACTPGREETIPSGRLLRWLCAWLCLLSLLAPLTPLRAQSGRKKGTPTPAQSGVERPRTAKESLPSPTPAASPAPSTSPALAGPIATPPASSDKTNARATRPPANGATPGADEVGEDDVVRINSNLVPVPASVVDARGRAVADLQLKDFELLVDGEVKPLADLTRSQTPVQLALLYDNSSSLRAGRDFERQAAIRFLKSVLRPVDRAAIYSISTEPTLSMPLTNDIRALVRTIESFDRPEGATALLDAIAQAAQYLKSQTGRKVIVVVSDGTDTISDLDFDTTLARVLASDCQVYAVQTGHSENINLLDLAGQRRLEEFTSQTGGAVYVPHSAADLGNAFTQIAADLAQQYVLSYYPAGDHRDGRFHNFVLRVATRPNLRVRTRKGYYAPKGEEGGKQ